MATTQIQLNEALLDQKLAELEKARSWSPRVVSKLEAAIRTADDYDLFRINPLRYAKDKGIAEQEAIDLFLYATKQGLFEIEWHLVCRSCGHLIDNFADLSRVHAHAVCDVCRADYHAALDDYIQVSFTVAAAIRDIVWRHPELLPIEDFYLKYHLCNTIAPVGNTPWAEVLRSVTRIMTYLEPGARATAEVELLLGMLGATDLLNKTTITFLTSANQSTAPQSLSLKMRDSKFQLLGQEVQSLAVSVGSVTLNMEQYSPINLGSVRVDVENVMPTRCAVWLVNIPVSATDTANLPQFEQFLSGKKLLTTQTFRDLFRTEVIDAAEGIAIRDITFLFTDLKGSTALYDQIGDPKAYFLVRQHFDTLGQAIADKSGAVVKTIGDAVMATFENPANAVDAALTMIERIEAFNQNISQPLSLKIGIHKGHSIAVTLNDRLDYFGQTVNIAARIQSLADANEIYVSSAVYDAPGVAESLKAHHVTPEQASVKGVSEKLQVYKIKVRR